MSENSNPIEIHRDKDGEGAVSAARAWDPFETLRGEIDRLFDAHLLAGFGRRGWRLPFAQRAGATPWPQALEWGAAPAVDVVEKDTAFEISAELPGLGRENIDIQISADTLTLRGEKKEEREEKDRNRYVSERRYGRFERAFRLPDGVDRDRIDAAFEKGILKIVLPKTAEAQRQSRKIEVKERKG